jgi:hypothetical protein
MAPKIIEVSAGCCDGLQEPIACALLEHGYLNARIDWDIGLCTILPATKYDKFDRISFRLPDAAMELSRLVMHDWDGFIKRYGDDFVSDRTILKFEMTR